MKNIGLNNFDVKVVEQNTNYVFAGTQSGLYFTSNNAENWKLIEIPMLKTAINSIVTFKNLVFIGTNGNGVFFSTDEGKTWEQINSGLNNLKINCLSIINDNLFAGTIEGGVYRAKLSDFGFSEVKEDKLFDNSFSIFPNPAQKQINITLKSELNNKFNVDSKCKLYDLSGSLILESIIPNGSNTLIIIELLTNGLYFVKINNEINTFMKW